MDGIVALLLSKKFTKDTVIGMGAIKGAACQVQSINKVDKTTTITLKWEDNVGVVHTQAFDIEDGLDGVSVQNATIKPNGHLELTLSDGNIIDCGKVLPQYDTMPTPSSSNEGQILQYIGTTTSNYTNGYFYKCVLKSGVYDWERIDVQPPSEDPIQVTGFPPASATNMGDIYQYIGTSTADYTNGCFYKCTYDTQTGTYSWTPILVQAPETYEDDPIDFNNF